MRRTHTLQDARYETLGWQESAVGNGAAEMNRIGRPTMHEREVRGHIFALISAALKPLSWFCIMALMAASWTPGQEMIRTGFNARLEHIFAYLLAVIAVSLAYPRLRLMPLALSMMAYASILEVGQLFVAGRHTGLLDWTASSIGVVCGCCSIWLARSRFLPPS